MRTSKRLLLILCICSVFPLWGATTAVHGLQQLPWRGLFPVDAHIGILSDVATATSEPLALVYEAFSSSYGIDWYERFVDADARVSLNRMYNQMLAEILPAVVSIGKMEGTPSQSAVKVKVHRDEQAFLLLDVVVRKGESGTWSIVSLSVR